MHFVFFFSVLTDWTVHNGSNNTQSLRYTGADSVASYQSILRQILYFNRKPAYFLNRAFKLSCSELNGRFTSNDYIQTLTVIHPQGPQSNLLPLHTLTPSVDSALHSPPHHSSSSSPSLSSSAGLSSHDSPTVNTLQRSEQHAKESVSAARAQVHEHRVDVKDPHVKSVSSGFLDSGLMDASDAFPRSECYILAFAFFEELFNPKPLSDVTILFSAVFHPSFSRFLLS